MELLALERLQVVVPGRARYPLAGRVEAVGLATLVVALAGTAG